MKLQKITLTAVYINDKDKLGNPFISPKTGKAYSKMSLKAVEFGDKYIGGFVNQTNQNWKAGDVVEVIVETNGEYLNFKNPTEEQLNNIRITALEASLLEMKLDIAQLKASTAVGTVSAAKFTGKTPDTTPTMEDIQNEYLDSGVALEDEIPY